MTSCRFSRWRISAILDFRGPIIGSLKSPCTTSYRSSIETIARNCLVFEKIAFVCILATNRRRDGKHRCKVNDALSRCRYRERRIDNSKSVRAYVANLANTITTIFTNKSTDSLHVVRAAGARNDQLLGSGPVEYLRFQ